MLASVTAFQFLREAPGRSIIGYTFQVALDQPNAFTDLLAAKGISLQKLGLREVTLLRTDALLAVEYLRASSIPILGGDVYFIQGDTIAPAYANWHSDQRPTEPSHEFAERRSTETTRYITAFPHRPDVVPLFVLVVP